MNMVMVMRYRGWIEGGPGEGRGVVYTVLVVCNYFNT